MTFWFLFPKKCQRFWFLFSKRCQTMLWCQKSWPTTSTSAASKLFDVFLRMKIKIFLVFLETNIHQNLTRLRCPYTHEGWWLNDWGGQQHWASMYCACRVQANCKTTVLEDLVISTSICVFAIYVTFFLLCTQFLTLDQNTKYNKQDFSWGYHITN